MRCILSCPPLWGRKGPVALYAHAQHACNGEVGGTWSRQSYYCTEYPHLPTPSARAPPSPKMGRERAPTPNKTAKKRVIFDIIIQPLYPFPSTDEHPMIFSPPCRNPSQGPTPEEIKAFFKAIHANSPGPFQDFLNKHRKAATLVREPETGATPLMAAAKRGYLTMVEDLLYGSAEVNASDAVGCTALMLAAMQNKFNIVRLLVEKGADLEMKTVIGATALVFTTYDNAVESARILLAAGADTGVLEDHHCTAMMRGLMNERLAAAGTPAGAVLSRSEKDVKRKMALEFAKLKGGLTGPANDATPEKKTRLLDDPRVTGKSSA
ncbi:MAG: ankyrin repeat domain-containing protein [Alphaproteobacteria bacterium]|nr:MAG: ankyrin repeat domain-containing protein [Alphaproteobacteria bacterium]